MMIRSMPPSSAHLADRPMPAPPPMIGRPAATWARRRWRHSSRVNELIVEFGVGAILVANKRDACGLLAHKRGRLWLRPVRRSFRQIVTAPEPFAITSPSAKSKGRARRRARPFPTEFSRIASRQVEVMLLSDAAKLLHRASMQLADALLRDAEALTDLRHRHVIGMI